METIAIVFFGLAVLVLVLAIVYFKKFYKPIGGDEYLKDDAPARYEDYEECFYSNP